VSCSILVHYAKFWAINPNLFIWVIYNSKFGGVEILKKYFLSILIVAFLFLAGCSSNNSSTVSTTNQETSSQNVQPVNNPPMIGDFVARCCYDTISNGVVLYGNQLISNRRAFQTGDTGQEGPYQSMVSIFGAYQGFSKSDISKIDAYCNNGGRIAPSVANNEGQLDGTDAQNGKDPLSSSRIILNYIKNIESSSTDNCILIVNLKNGNVVNKNFIIKIIGSKN